MTNMTTTQQQQTIPLSLLQNISFYLINAHKESIRFFKKYCIFFSHTIAQKKPCPEGNEIYNFGRPFLCHHYHVHSFSDLCLGVENSKKILNETMHFHYIIYMAIHSHKNAYSKVKKFTIQVDPYLVIKTIYTFRLIYAQTQRRVIKKYTYFTHLNYFIRGGGAVGQSVSPATGRLGDSKLSF